MGDRSQAQHDAINRARIYSACDDFKPVKKWVIYPGAEAYPLGDGVQVMPLHIAMRSLADGHRD